MRHVADSAARVAAWGQQSVSGSDHYDGELFSATGLRRRAKKATNAGYFGSATGHYGTYHVSKDYTATISKRWHDMSERDKRNLFLIRMATTLLCAAAAALVSGIPDSTEEPITILGVDLNWFVDLAANGLFIAFLLPVLKLAFSNLYADKKVPDHPTGERPVLVHSSENPRENDKQWAQVKYDRGQFDFTHPEDAAIKLQWSTRKEVTRDNMSQYVAMLGRQLYSKNLTKVVVLTMIPYLAKLLPGSSAEHTGNYKGVNFLWETMIGFAVLMLHGVIRQYVVGPAARAAGYVAYGGHRLLKPCLDRRNGDELGYDVTALERGDRSPDVSALLGGSDGDGTPGAAVAYQPVGAEDSGTSAAGLAAFSMGSSSDDDSRGEASSPDTPDAKASALVSKGPSPFS